MNVPDFSLFALYFAEMKRWSPLRWGLSTMEAPLRWAPLCGGAPLRWGPSMMRVLNDGVLLWWGLLYGGDHSGVGFLYGGGPSAVGAPLRCGP